MSDQQQTTTADRQSALYAALSRAQERAGAVAHDANNQFHKYRYTSAEAIIGVGKAALAAEGLALLPEGQSYTADGGTVWIVRTFTLVHKDGGAAPVSTQWPVIPDKGRPLDKAVASAATTSLAYLLRDLLLMPRVEQRDDISARDDRPREERRPRPERPAISATPPPPAPRQATPPPAPEPGDAAEPTVDEEQHAAICGLIEETQSDPRAFLDALARRTNCGPIGDTDQIPAAVAGEAVRMLMGKKTKMLAAANGSH